MRFHVRFVTVAVAFLVAASASTMLAQQKPQWMPGQVGLNAGIPPDPGFTYLNITVNYSADQFNGPRGNAIPVTGTYDVWTIENYILPQRILRGNLGFVIILTPATGSLDADITNPNFPNLSAAAAAAGLPISGFSRLRLAGTSNEPTSRSSIRSWFLPADTHPEPRIMSGRDTSAITCKQEQPSTSQKTRGPAPTCLPIGKFTEADQA